MRVGDHEWRRGRTLSGDVSTNGALGKYVTAAVNDGSLQANGMRVALPAQKQEHNSSKAWWKLHGSFAAAGSAMAKAKGKGLLDGKDGQEIFADPKEGSSRSKPGRKRNVDAALSPTASEADSRPRRKKKPDKPFPSLVDEMALLKAPPASVKKASVESKPAPAHMPPLPRSQVTFGISDKNVAADMRQLYSLINAFSFDLHKGGDMNTAAVPLDPAPQKELAELYATVFSGAEWRAKYIELQARIGLSSIDVLGSLVSAGVCSSVFAVNTPWRMQAIDTDGLGRKWLAVMEVLADDGYHVDELLDRAASRMILQPDFKSGALSEHAALLADTLALTLHPHIQRMTGSRRTPKSRAWSMKGGVVTWMADLREIFQKALMLKTRIETTSDTSFDFRWYQGREGLDEDEMEMLYQGDLPQEVGITIMPGVTADSARDGTRVAKRAMVLSHPADGE
ncbi:hypothetical protein LTR85_006781 [Meristemomyces frigidus]|nr:hypothetical protein LTR85_006781 [Meristemomyces frigidus]